MRLGISSYTYVWSVGVPGFASPANPLSVLGLLQKAVELSVRVVQIADNMPLHLLSDKELDAVCEFATEHQISLEVGTCGIAVDHLRNYLAIADRFDSPVLRVVTDTEKCKPQPDEIVDTFNSLRDEFARANVCLVIENHDRLSAATLRRIVERCESEFVGVCLDTANSLGCGEGLETVVSQLAPLVVNLHVKDFQVSRLPHLKGFIIEGRPAGQGQVNIPWLLKQLRPYKRSLNAIVELWPPPQATLADSIVLEQRWAIESVGYLRKLISD